MLTYLCLLLSLAISDAPTARDVPANARVVPVTFASKALAGQRQYVAWLPPGYREDADYPVVILLHGLGAEGAEWFDPARGDLTPTLQRLMAAKQIDPFIALAPDGGAGYWTDHLGAPRARYGAFIDEVVADADRRFAIDVRRKAIVGVSMGGHGALSRALMAPATYRAAVSISGALFSEPPTHRPIYKKVWGSPADRAHWEATSPMAIAQRMSASDKLPAMFIACGRSDNARFVAWNDATHALLDMRGLAHTFVTVDGGHDWPTWRGLAEQWLTWLSPRLR